jgi:hypothetical protein
MSSTAPSDHSRGIVDFRDTVVGHILDNDTKRPFNVARDR